MRFSLQDLIINHTLRAMNSLHMLTKLKLFFESLNAPVPDKTKENLSLEMACAVLLYEVMRADGEFAEQEKQQLNLILKQQFSLDEQTLTELNEQAQQISENATDFFRFTTKINQHYDLQAKKNIVALLWQVAYADGELASIEEHVIRRIADLLHLNHQEYIVTKSFAQKQNG